ncbi:MAG: Uma2 family endonuclease [Chitinophagaceae bacterium]|nr:Uma2 family endonuclease [Chitinophagaceae bacterium]
MSSIVKILPHYTYDDYCRWEGRWELIEGIPHAMSPAPSPKHQWVSANLMHEFKTAIKKAGCKHCKVYNFIDVKIKDDTVLQPDVLIVCKEISKPFLDFPASLVVEVLSYSTALKDRNVKMQYYAQMSIRYYLMIDPEKQTVEIYKLSENEEYNLLSYDTAGSFNFTFEEDCSAEVMLQQIWE